MKKSNSRLALSRRDLLKLAAAAGVAIAGGHLLFTYTPFDNLGQAADRARQPFAQNPDRATKMRELVRYATLAANGHNAQPWKFSIQENAIEIHPDLSRRLPVVDPTDRELWISLGCALENLVIAARAAGYATEVTYPERAGSIRVALTADSPVETPLFSAIPQRQNTRSAYDGQKVKTADLEQLEQMPLEPGVRLSFAHDAAQMEMILEYVNQGNLAQYADAAFVKELIAWLRFNRREAQAARDGLYTRCTGNPEVPRWLGQLFVSGAKPKQQADSDAQKLRSSPGAVIIATESEDKTTLVRAGQVYERLALTMTSLGIRSAFLNQPIEVADLRPQFQTAMGLGTSLPQLLVRYGYAAPMPSSFRRPVEEVLL